MRYPLILAYHRVNPSGEDGLSVRVEDFRSHLAYLHERGWRCLTLSEYIDQYLKSGKSVPRRTFILTFDDGYRDNWLYAYPIVRYFGFRATIFLPVKLIDQGECFPWLRNSCTTEEARPLSWKEVHNMKEGGIEFGSHTLHHVLLTRVPRDVARREIEESRFILEERLRKKIRSFCYPAGDMNAEIAEMVQQAGYEAAVITPSQRSIPVKGRFALRRVGLYRGDSLFVFRLKISWGLFQCRTSAGAVAYCARAKSSSQDMERSVRRRSKLWERSCSARQRSCEREV